MTGGLEVIEVRNGGGETVIRRGPFLKGSAEADRAWSCELQSADMTNRGIYPGDWRTVRVYRVDVPTPSTSEPRP